MTEIQHIKLSELANKIQAVISDAFGLQFYWIIAEISNHKLYSNPDRHYFEFIEKEDKAKDPIVKLRGISWSNGSQKIKSFERVTGQRFTNGIQVLVKVKVEFHSSYGFSLVLQDIDPSFTLGNLEKQRRDTLLKLVTENPSFIQKVEEEYITKNKELQLPSVIQTIAIIGSTHSEGYHDFIHTIMQNQFNYTFALDVYHSSVQGMEAEEELKQCLTRIDESQKKYDCVVIIRGGGSKSDFMVFDNYDISREVAKFPIPIITGIGHLNDVSIVDLMANTSTKTPTKAAEFIIFHNKTFEDLIVSFQKTIIIKTQQTLSEKNQRISLINLSIINNSNAIISYHKEPLNHFKEIIINKTKTVLSNRRNNLVTLLNQMLTKPKFITANKNTELVNLMNNLKSYAGTYLKNQNSSLGHYASMMNLMKPDNILKKGFAIIRQNDKIIKDIDTIEINSDISIETEKHKIGTKVISKTKK